MRCPLQIVTCALGALAACGDDGLPFSLADAPPGADASPGDTRADTAPPDAPLVPVTLAVTLDGTPAVGIQVYFQNADSVVTQATTTGPDGIAHGAVTAGGSVTALEPVRADLGVAVVQRALDTFAGVVSGDELHLDLGQSPAMPVAITFDVTVPLLDGATHYELHTTCGNADLTPAPALHRTGRRSPAARGPRPEARSAAPSAVPVTLVDCGGTADLLLVAVDDSFTVVGTILVADQAVAAGQALAIAGPYTLPGTTHLSFTGIPPAIPGLGVSKDLVTARGPLFDAFTNVVSTVDPGSDVGHGSADLAYPPTAATPGLTQIVFTAPQVIGRFDRPELLDWGPPSDDYARDVSTLLLQGYDTDPAFDLASHAVTWTVGASGLPPDLVLVTVDAERTAPGIENLWTWRVSAPGTAAGHVTLPAVPTDVFDFTIGATDSVFVQIVATATVPGGYDAVRAHAFAFDPQLLPATGGSGHAAVTDLAGENLARRSMYTRRK